MTNLKKGEEPVGLELVASNRAAFHDYFILERLEAGLVLKGTEVKSLRAKHCVIKDSYARVDPKGNLEILNLHINPYAQGNRYNPDPTRTRRLLAHRKQIDKLAQALATKGVTLVPLRVYFRNGVAKLELGLGKGKQQHDKRQAIREREADREARQAFKMRQR